MNARAHVCNDWYKYVTCFLPVYARSSGRPLRLDSSQLYKARSGPIQTILNSAKFRPGITMSSANINVDDAATLATDKQLEKNDDSETISTAVPAPERGTAFWLAFFAICLAPF